VLNDVPESFIFSAAPYPARAIQPLASQLAAEITEYTWWGRTFLHIREGEERQAHLKSLILGIQLELKAIDERKVQLEEEKSQMQTATKMYEEMQEKLRGARESERILKQEVCDMKANPIVTAGLHFHSRMSQGAILGTRRPVSAHQRSQSLEIPEVAPAGATPQEGRPPLFDDELDSSDDEIQDDDVVSSGFEAHGARKAADREQDFLV
jgi:hypothetical protein